MTTPRKVLIIDDDVSFAESNVDLLEAYGYEVFCANDGASGLAKAREVVPDVIILDVMMATDTEGFDIARKIPDSAELRNAKVLLVTGMTSALRVAGTLKPDSSWLPVDRVLEKPISPEQLLAEVERVLTGKKS